MLRWFNAETDSKPVGEKSAVRALQAWQYLIGKAVNRQIVQYEELRILMEYPTSNPLTPILGCIMNYCEQHDLPPLTLIVVNKSGIPGEGFTAEKNEDYHQRREDVFNFSWFKLVPPTVEELNLARKNS
jgi:putative restriction endonuclease